MNHAIISQCPEIRAEIRIEEARRFLIYCKVAEWICFKTVPVNIFTEVFDLIDSGWRWKYALNEDSTAFKKSLDKELTTREKNSGNLSKGQRQEERKQRINGNNGITN